MANLQTRNRSNSKMQVLKKRLSNKLKTPNFTSKTDVYAQEIVQLKRQKLILIVSLAALLLGVILNVTIKG